MSETQHVYEVGDCLEKLKGLPDQSVDLVFCSPPYEDARLYGELNYKVKGQDWVDWCLPRYLECLRVCKGLVAWVVEGKTKNFRWSATPALLMADLHRAGVKLRKPPAYKRVGIPGSGGPDWLRNDYELIVCASHGRLPWSDSTVMGEPPKWGVGGLMSNRHADGQRVNAGVSRNNPRKRSKEEKLALGGKKHTKHDKHTEMRQQVYLPPPKANPGNVIHCIVGGGVMGHKLCHENEAPFPEDLAKFFILSFCPPGGTVLDPFGGSGTTSCVAKCHGRNSLSYDLRPSQRAIWEQRIIDPRYTPEVPCDTEKLSQSESVPV